MSHHPRLRCIMKKQVERYFFYATFFPPFWNYRSTFQVFQLRNECLLINFPSEIFPSCLRSLFNSSFSSLTNKRIIQFSLSLKHPRYFPIHVEGWCVWWVNKCRVKRKSLEIFPIITLHFKYKCQSIWIKLFNFCCCCCLHNFVFTLFQQPSSYFSLDWMFIARQQKHFYFFLPTEFWI